ncbi:MAG: iron-containing alcohol dehydrogenase [Desulfobacterales bacterium]
MRSGCPSASRYPVCVGWGTLAGLGPRMRDLGLCGTAHIVSDETVWSIYGEKAKTSLQEAGIPADHLRFAPGEASKTLETAARMYDWLVECRAEREDCIVALGGGVVGDLAGFVAATFLRGVHLVHVPTSLIAMVDASIGADPNAAVRAAADRLVEVGADADAADLLDAVRELDGGDRPHDT